MDTPSTAPLPIRLLDTALRLIRWLVMLATGLLLVLGVLAVIGVGSVTLNGSTDEVRPLTLEPGEYQIDAGDQRLDVAETTVFESDDGAVRFGPNDVEITIGDGAVAVRLLAIGMMGLWLGLAWIGVTNLGAVARSTRDGDAFTEPNARRLRRVGWVCVAFPALTTIGQLVLRQMVDRLDLAGPAVSVDVSVSGWWAWVVAGLSLLAVAEVFTHGVALRELDESTI